MAPLTLEVLIVSCSATLVFPYCVYSVLTWLSCSVPVSFTDTFWKFGIVRTGVLPFTHILTASLYISGCYTHTEMWLTGTQMGSHHVGNERYII